jgi:hypothetical protein
LEARHAGLVWGINLGEQVHQGGTTTYTSTKTDVTKTDVTVAINPHDSDTRQQKLSAEQTSDEENATSINENDNYAIPDIAASAEDIARASDPQWACGLVPRA